MSPLSAPPPPAPPAPRRRRRTLGAWLSEKPEKRSVQAAIVATILVHLLLILAAPHWFKAEPSIPHQRKRPPLNFRLSPPPPRPKATAQKARPKLVETNPNAPQNKPDNTNNVSNRDQQSAQEKASKIHTSDMPAQEGRKNFQNDQIVDGRLSKPQEAPPVPEVQQPPRPPSQAAPHAEQNPLSGKVKNQGTSPTDFGSNIAPESSNPRPIPKHIAGTPNAPLFDAPTFAAPQIDPKHPRERRSLDVHSRPAIIAENLNGTARVGVVGRNAHWSRYGEYMNRLEEAVQARWDAIMEHAPYPPPGSTVQITFILTSAGEIRTFVHVESSPGTTEIGTRACESALQDPAPYGKWSEDMIAALGTEDQLQFTFYYE